MISGCLEADKVVLLFMGFIAIVFILLARIYDLGEEANKK